MRHRRIDLDSSVAAVAVAMEALRVARSQQTSTNGTSAWRNPDGTETVVGPGAGLDETGAPNGIIQWVGDTTPPGKPTGISCSSAWGVLYVKWDGTLAGGVPADFAYVSILVDGEEIARMFEAGTAVKDGLEDGAEVEVSAVAYDSARDREGNLDPNASEPFGPITVEVSDERAVLEADVQSAAQKADAAAAKADSYQEQIDDVAATVNGVEQEVESFSTQIQGAVEDASQALTAATEASQDLAGFKTTVSKTYVTKSDADTDYQPKGDYATGGELDSAIAQEVLDRNSAIEQSASEITSTVSQTYSTKAELGAVEDKADAAQSAAESASSAASAAQGDLDGFKGAVSSTYATKTEVEQTAESIEQTVSETYQVKGDYATSGEVDEAIEQEVANRNSAISQSATQIQQTVSQTYLSKDDAEADYQPKGSYATTAQLTQTAESINATVAEVSGTADSALAKASEVEQTAEGLTVTLTSTTATANNALSKANSAASAASSAQSAADDAASAASAAQNTANTAVNTANSANTAATNAAKTATNFLKFDSAGLCVGNQTGTLGYNTLIKSGGMDIRNGTTVLASFTSSQIDLGKNSRSTTINMANGGVIISADDNSARFDSGFDGSIVIGGASPATTGGSHAALSVSRATITLNTVGMLDDGGVYVNGKAVQPFIGITGWTYLYGSLASGNFVRARKMGSYLVVMQWEFVQATTTYWKVPNLLPSSMWPSSGVYAAAVRTDSAHYLTNNTAYAFVGGGGEVGFQCGNSQSGGYNAGCVAWFTG